MVLSTLTDIQGQFGLPNSADSNSLANANKSIFDTVNSLLAQTRSNSLESLTARGLGRSTFGEQAINKQSMDVLNQATSLIANNNLANANADNQMWRDIQKMSAETDLKSKLSGDQAIQLGNAESKLQLEQFLPTLLLDQAKNFADNKPAPLFDWIVGAFTGAYNKSTGRSLPTAPTSSSLFNSISNFLNGGNSGNLFGGIKL